MFYENQATGDDAKSFYDTSYAMLVPHENYNLVTAMSAISRALQAAIISDNHDGLLSSELRTAEEWDDVTTRSQLEHMATISTLQGLVSHAKNTVFWVRPLEHDKKKFGKTGQDNILKVRKAFQEQKLFDFIGDSAFLAKLAWDFEE